MLTIDYNIKNTKCAMIWIFREIKGKKYDYKTKRFLFEQDTHSDGCCDNLVLGPPTATYYLELKNENANKTTSTADFIAGAKLILCCWLGIDTPDYILELRKIERKTERNN
jgi:hypothetical protein